MAKIFELQEYPTPHARRTGCKVSWYTYADKATAERCSHRAIHNARILEQRGYDFGYQSPGAMEKVTLGWEVVIP